MELKQLHYFIVLCEELHFTRAAEKLGIAQPSLSQQIQLLEHDIGTPLIDRVGKKNVITEAGKALLHHSYTIFHELSQARAAISDIQGLERGTLKIGALLTVVNYLLPTTIIEFHQTYPNVELSIQGLRTGDIFEKILQNELDLGIVALPVEHQELESIPLYDENLVLVLHRDHPLAKKSTVTLEILKEYPAILLPNSYYIREMINDSCATFSFQPEPVMEMTTMESIIHMVAHQVGVTILPKAYIDYVQHDVLRTVPIRHPKLKREVGIVYRKNKFLCAASRVFMDTLIKRIHDTSTTVKTINPIDHT